MDDAETGDEVPSTPPTHDARADVGGPSDDDTTGADADSDADGTWASLFSGGKDSTWALYEALERDDVAVSHLVTVHPDGDSYLYHTLATDLAGLLAESIGLPLVEVEAEMPGGGSDDDGGPTADGPGDGAAGPVADVSERGDAEVEPLADALAELDASLDGGLAGVTAGAVASTFQRDRVAAVCDDLGAGLFAPLWGAEPVPALERMLATGFEIRVVAVAADGMDESWLGRRLDESAIEELAELHEERGVHPMGEGGEFETLVTDGPHMDRPLELDYEVRWDGTRGHLDVTDAWLE